MKNFGKWALCLLVCVAFLALPAMAGDPWEDKEPGGGEGGPPMNPGVNSSYNGQPMMLDAYPWIDGPPQKGKLDPVIPTMAPSAWWLQPALDYHPWAEDPPKGKDPQTP